MLPGGGGGARFIPPDEYKEFLSLGHGGVFDLDLDNVDVAPWRLPGADIGAYFNFGLNEHKWREYASEVRHKRLELTMQASIQTFDGDQDARRSEARTRTGPQRAAPWREGTATEWEAWAEEEEEEG